MAELVIGPAREVVKCFVEPIKRQFNYIYYFNTNIQNVKDEAKRLDDAKEGLQRQVEAAKRNTDDIVPEVDTWLGKVDEIQKDYLAMEHEILNVKSGCLAIKSRFSLSRKATKMAADLKKLHDDCGKFGQISIPAPPAAMSLIPFGQVYELKSRKDFEEDVMTTLREKKVRLMGLHGMGGVGKTTMAKRIMTRSREEGLFDEIVIAVVSQPVDKLRVQKELAELLDFDLKFDSLLARAQRLRDRLMNSKSILIILDDLWKGLDLEELGIPKECTILLTSRDRDVFCTMNVDQIFQVKTLDEVEAWSLFKEKVGTCADDQSLTPTARKIVRECKGLPIAIVTVGVALKDVMDKSIWENSVHELRSCNPRDIPDFLEQVYNPLRLSYDLLDSPCARSIFLLCCLFPEDHDILISNLYLYAWGLGMFERISSLQAARNKVQTVIKMLLSRSLLLDGRKEGHVKMHDVHRDVGIFIAAKEGLIDPSLNWKSWAREEGDYIIDCSWISLFGDDTIMARGESAFPKLCFLLVEEPSRIFCENLFEIFGKLSVLSLSSGYFGPGLLPHKIQLQENMRTLILVDCYRLEDISVVGELVSLEILHCHYCLKVKELPVELGRLNKLKLLHISNCRNLKTIKAGVISKLIRLEELTLIHSFENWELAVEEGGNAAVCELNSLSRLTTLKIQIKDASLAAVQIHLPKLVEFDVTLGGYFEIYFYNGDWALMHSRRIRLELKRDVIIGDWIPQLLRSSECLVLKEEGSRKLLPLLPQIQSLKELCIENVKFERTTATVFPLSQFQSLKQLCIVNVMFEGTTTTVFPLLESLLGDNEVERTEAAFDKLEILEVKNCDDIKSLFSPSIARNLVNLRELTIKRCCEMVKVIEDDNEVERSLFTSLEVLELQGLPKLKDFYFWECALKLPSLTKVRISGCPLMERFLRGSLSSNSFQDLVVFGKLKIFEVIYCKNIKSLFSPSIARNLVNLRELVIESCGDMVKVIEDKDNNEVERSPFINLEKIELRNLPMLKNFCDWECALQFLSLIEVHISECPLMERFPFFSDSLKDLKSIEIESCLMLEQVILLNGEEGGNDINRRITFPKLGKLVLRDLPRLTSLCKGIQSIEFPLLRNMEIDNCPNMKNLVSTAENETCPRAINMSEAAVGVLETIILDGISIERRPLSLLCDQVQFGSFSGLEDLLVLSCGNIKSLFSSSVAGNLVNLRELRIVSCGEMVKVIEGDEDKSSLFIKLKNLELEDLPKLKSFCDWRCALELPSLEKVDISSCYGMERFSFGSFTAPNLKVISIGDEFSNYIEDLNDAPFRGGSFPLPKWISDIDNRWYSDRGEDESRIFKKRKIG